MSASIIAIIASVLGALGLGFLYQKKRADNAVERQKAAQGQIKRDVVETKAVSAAASEERDERAALDAKMADLNTLAKARQDAAVAKEAVAEAAGNDADAAVAETIRQMKEGKL